MTEPALKTRNCRWLAVPGAADARGRINFLEVGQGLPFQPQRLFWLHHIAPGQWRGRHGHRESELVLVALHGGCRVHLDDGRVKEQVVLDDPGRGLHVGTWVWHELRFRSRDGGAGHRLDALRQGRVSARLRGLRARGGGKIMIPFLDMKAVYAELKPELDAAYARVMESGWFVLGKEVEAFEAEYAAFCGTRHCVGLGNGLEALELALRAWDLGAGDEVVPSNTHIATWLAVTAGRQVAGRGRPNIDPRRIAAAITSRTGDRFHPTRAGRHGRLAPPASMG
jgi:hypothetical protein